MAEGSQGFMDRMRGWNNWLTTHVSSSIKNNVSDASNTMKRKMVRLYNGDQWHDARERQKTEDEDEQWYDTNSEEKLTPILTKHGIKKKVKNTS
jgi:hypothetical protein